MEDNSQESKISISFDETTDCLPETKHKTDTKYC